VDRASVDRASVDRAACLADCIPAAPNWRFYVRALTRRGHTP
jgi:hypothetical protein